MEASEVRRHVRDHLAEARRAAADRRSRRDEASRVWSDVLERVALPVLRQLAQVLKAEGHPVQLFTPADQVRIAVDGHPEDFVELRLDTTGDDPAVVSRLNQVRGRETLSDERVFVQGGDAIAGLTEEQVLDHVARALAGMLVR